MDHQPYESGNTFVAPNTGAMPTAALTVAIIGLVFSFIPCIGTICPAVAVTLALLARGGQMKTAGKSKAALILGLLGIIICFTMTVFAIYYFATQVDYQQFFQDFRDVYQNNQDFSNYL